MLLRLGGKSLGDEPTIPIVHFVPIVAITCRNGIETYVDMKERTQLFSRYVRGEIGCYGREN